MEPAEVEVTESEADVMGPEGVGWGLVLERPPPGELDDTGDPQPQERGSSEGECPLDGLPSCEGEELWRRGAKGIIFSTLFPALKKDSALILVYRGRRDGFCSKGSGTIKYYLFFVDAAVTNGLPRRRE